MSHEFIEVRHLRADEQDPTSPFRRRFDNARLVAPIALKF